MGKGNRNRQNRQNSPGYKFSSTERKEVNELIAAAILEQEHRLSMEVDAAWLWQLYTRYDWPVDQLREIYKAMESDHAEIRKRYDISPGDSGSWVYVKKCADAGIKIEEWYAEPPE